MLVYRSYRSPQLTLLDVRSRELSSVGNLMYRGDGILVGAIRAKRVSLLKAHYTAPVRLQVDVTSCGSNMALAPDTEGKPPGGTITRTIQLDATRTHGRKLGQR